MHEGDRTRPLKIKSRSRGYLDALFSIIYQQVATASRHQGPGLVLVINMEPQLPAHTAVKAVSCAQSPLSNPSSD